MPWKHSHATALVQPLDREAMIAALNDLVERACDQHDEALERDMRLALGDELLDLMRRLPDDMRLPLRDLEAVLIAVSSRIARDHGSAVLDRLLVQAGELGRLIAPAA